jgi:hypothetical protein
MKLAKGSKVYVGRKVYTDEIPDDLAKKLNLKKPPPEPVIKKDDKKDENKK